MTGYPLQSVLELRRREEEEAMARFADATRSRKAAEEQAERLVAALELAHANLQEAAGSEPLPSRLGSGKGPSAAEALAGARFVDRRRDELKGAGTALAQFRNGPLRRAHAAEADAREKHAEARRAREAFEKHAAKHQAAARAVVDRREEETLEDSARATRHHRDQR